MPKFDYSPYDVIVFDEVFMLGTFWKNKIRLFNKDNPNKIRILTGDTKQLPSLEKAPTVKMLKCMLTIALMSFVHIGFSYQCVRG